MEQQDKLSNEQEFESLVLELNNWANTTFGKRPPVARVHHLKKEVLELIEAMEKDPENWRAIQSELADCFLLIIDASKEFGLTASGIISNARDKFEKAKMRKWGIPDANGVVEHIRTESELPNSEQEVKECDASKAEASTEAGNKTPLISKGGAEEVEKLRHELLKTKQAWECDKAANREGWQKVEYYEKENQKLREALTQKAGDGWKEVENPPTKSGFYLCYNPNNAGFDEKLKQDIYRYSDYNNSWYWGSDTFHPSHWRELPDNPKQLLEKQ